MNSNVVVDLCICYLNRPNSVINSIFQKMLVFFSIGTEHGRNYNFYFLL